MGIPAFGGGAMVAALTGGQAGNVTTVPPAAVIAPPPPPPPPPAPAALPSLPPIGDIGSYGDAGLPAPTGATIGLGTAAVGGVDSWTRSILREGGGLLGELGGFALGQAVSDNPRVAFVTGQIGKELGKSLADQFYDSFNDTGPTPLDYSSNITPQTVPTTPPSLPYYPTQPGKLAPLIDRNCPACSGDLETLEGQRGELEKEIQTEQAQQRGTQIQQRAQQLQHFEDLEKQPASQRNIDTELQQKQQILQDLDNQIAQLQQQLNTQPGQYPVPTRAPAPAPGTSPLITTRPPPQVVEARPVQPSGYPDQSCPPGFHQCGTDTECEEYGNQPGVRKGCAPDGNPYDQPMFQQREQPKNMPNPQQRVTFCVGCASQSDALQFLNGEPSQCSVLPNSEE